MKVSVELINFKRIKELKQEFVSGNIYLINGSNEKGKTSFLQALKSILTGTTKNKQAVTFGEKEGHVKGTFELDGGNNERYTIKLDYTDKGSKFTVIDPETNVKKSTSRNNIIADIFKYNEFTVEEFLAWGTTAEGRRKQADIILGLLPEELQVEYRDLEVKTDTTKGTLYLSRKEANNKYTGLKSIIDGQVFSEADEEILSNGDKASATLNNLKKQHNSYLDSKSDIDTITISVDALRKEKFDIDNTIEDKKESFQQSKLHFETEIENLKKMIKTSEESLKLIEDKYTAEIIALTNRPDEIDKEIEALKKDMPETPEGFNPEETKERIEKGEKYLEAYNVLKVQKDSYDKNKKALQESHDILMAKEQALETARSRKQQIINDSELPIDSIVIEDGECKYVDGDNKLPFSEENVSYSTSGLIVAKIMAHINKRLPIWLIGSASEYDNSRLDEFAKLAEQYNGIIIMDKVSEEEKELTIECIDKSN